MRNLKRKIQLLFTSILNILQRGSVAINVFEEERGGILLHKNWGDDLNLYLLELVSGRNIYAANKSLLHNKFNLKNFSCIGSILGMYENEATEVWGSGFISDRALLRKKPAKIHSVRGKLTRELLLSQGVECPEIYGDPALLVSIFYKAKPIGKFKLGIIPHYVDLEIKYILDFVKQNEDVLLIDVAHYNKWTDVCDQIVSCDFVISSSLHGLIAADSYGVPNIWVKFSDKVYGGNFKFLDYFSSVMRTETCPIYLQNINQIQQFLEISQLPSWDAKINYDMILESCPFK